MGQWRMGSVSNMIQGKINNDNNLELCVKFISDREACAIPDPDNEEVIITGGRHTMTTVSVYNKAGHQRDLASLNTGRRNHACTSFIYQNTKVDTER